MSCPALCQSQRLLAFTMPYVGDEDVVVMADADAFVQDGTIFDDLKRDLKVWLLVLPEGLDQHLF